MQRAQPRTLSTGTEERFSLTICLRRVCSRSAASASRLEPAVHELDELLIAAEYKPLVLPASLR